MNIDQEMKKKWLILIIRARSTGFAINNWKRKMSL